MNRVFKDSLIDNDDNILFDEIISDTLKDLKFNVKDIMEEKEHILFGEFIDKDQDIKNYKEIESFEKLKNSLEEILDD